MQYLMPVAGLLGILFSFWTFYKVKKKDEGSEKMKKIAEEIHTGAMVFLKREYTVIGVFMLVLFEKVAPGFSERNGGYTRVVKTKFRRGDNASMVIVSLVRE